MAGHSLAQNVHIITVLEPDADQYAADPASDVLNGGLYEEITFVLSEGAGGTGTATIIVEECTSNAGAGNTAIAFDSMSISTHGTYPAGFTTRAAAGYNTTAGANKMEIIRIRTADLTDGSPWVRVQLTEVVDSPCDAGMVALCSGSRYHEEVMKDPT